MYAQPTAVQIRITIHVAALSQDRTEAASGGQPIPESVLRIYTAQQLLSNGTSLHMRHEPRITAGYKAWQDYFTLLDAFRAGLDVEVRTLELPLRLREHIAGSLLSGWRRRTLGVHPGTATLSCRLLDDGSHVYLSPAVL